MTSCSPAATVPLHYPSASSMTASSSSSSSSCFSRRYSMVSMLSTPSTTCTRPDSAAAPFIPEDEDSYDLLPAAASSASVQRRLALEEHADRVLGAAHLRVLLSDPTLLARFMDFLAKRHTDGLRLLVYYLDAQKAVRAIRYANAVAAGLDALNGRDFSAALPKDTANEELQERADRAFDGLLDELSAFVAQNYVDVVSHNVARRITGSLKAELKDSVDGLGESFCLTDPSRPDNPIIFMSEEFNRVTQYGISYATGNNCRFLQGPRTDRGAVRRLKEAITAGREVSEIFMNYRRDGSSFMNLLMVAPLRDSNGTLRYFIGAQVDVSQPFLDNIGLESMKKLDALEAGVSSSADVDLPETDVDEFRDLAELFNDAETATARYYGGRLHQGRQKLPVKINRANARRAQRVMIKEPTPEQEDAEPRSSSSSSDGDGAAGGGTGLLKGVYQNYLLVRPYPSLRILFTSPTLRTPGIHQLPFLEKVGGSERVKAQLEAALRAGAGVTAKITWIRNRDTSEGRERYAHCTPLLDATGAVGVWIVLLVDAARPRVVNVYSDLFAKNAGISGIDTLPDVGLYASPMARVPSRALAADDDDQRFVKPAPAPAPPPSQTLPSDRKRAHREVYLSPGDRGAGPTSPISRSPSRSPEPGSCAGSRKLEPTEDTYMLDVPTRPRSHASTSGSTGRSNVHAFARSLSMVASN